MYSFPRETRERPKVGPKLQDEELMFFFASLACISYIPYILLHVDIWSGSLAKRDGGEFE